MRNFIIFMNISLSQDHFNLVKVNVQPKSVLRSRKSDFDMYSDDDQGPSHEDASRANSLKPAEVKDHHLPILVL